MLLGKSLWYFPILSPPIFLYDTTNTHKTNLLANTAQMIFHQVK